MNFKGTRNIPRDQVKGIIEQFGGTWNGYTWIDQTTYLETASTDALDRMLFIEAERMNKCLYDPEECESERTVIISELKGGENDPEQLLDIEVTATAFKVHPYRHPDHRLAVGRRDDDARRPLRPLQALLHRRPTPRIVIVGDVDTDDALRRVEQHFGASPPTARRRAATRRRAAAGGRAPGDTCARRGRPPTGRRRITRRRSATPTSFRCSSSMPC